MTEPVTHVLRDRGRDPDGLGRMFTISLIAHIVLIGGAAIVPFHTPGRSHDDGLRTVMTISLGGAPGPAAGGMTPMGGRPIQEVAQLPETRRPEPVRPPAARTPQMTAPLPTAKPNPVPRQPARTAPDEARGRTPTRGQETRAGSAIAETGGQGLGFGLSTGGGGTGGQFDVGDFCCPEYLSTMLQLIHRNWSSKQEVAGESVIRFTIQRDGRITDVQLARSSGYAALDLTAQRALLLTRQLPPLPAAYSPERLTVHLVFQYQR